MKKGNGLVSEADYPYTATGGFFSQCKSDGKKEVTKITDFSVISQDEDQIAAALAQYGPLSIGIDADPFQTYSSGVLDVPCGSQLDHGVAIVGFGTDNGKQYWKIRNSWGTRWGEDGYIRVVRGKGFCGLNTDVSTATGITVDGSGPAPAPTPAPSPDAPTPAPAPSPSGLTCDQCEAQGHGKDACDCGVCGSFGLCTWTCSPGGARVACDKVVSV